jgi:large subunit ribosomal protein L10
MPRPEKVQAVEEIRSRLDKARATFVTEYRGLTVGEQQQLRRSVQKAQGEYQVFKMSLARRAVEGLSLEGLPELLVGPTALAFANNDAVPVAKVLRDFANDHDKLIIKGGILGGALLPPEQISRLADIEPRDVLLSKVAGGFKAPMSKLAGLLGAKMRDAASMFSQLLEKKEADAPAVVEAPAAAAEPVIDEVTEVDSGKAAEEAPAEVVAEEAVAPEADAAPDAEVADDSAPEKKAAAEAEVVAEEAIAPEADAASDAEVAPKKKAAPEKKAAAETEVVAEEAVAPDAASDAEVADEPAPKKKAAPKAKADESSAKADAPGAPADGSDDTAEEE